jgi:hypothetical protein
MGIALNNNQLSGTIPSQLGMMTNMMKGMIVHNNQLTGQIPSELGLLSMGGLIVSNNSLSGTIPQELSALWQSLYVLRFDGNPLLSGLLPQALCGINGTCMSTILSPCPDKLGLIFDCTSLLCGCDCNCFI